MQKKHHNKNDYAMFPDYLYASVMIIFISTPDLSHIKDCRIVDLPRTSSDAPYFLLIPRRTTGLLKYLIKQLQAKRYIKD